MKINYTKFNKPQSFEYDIVIIGAGPVGIITASELKNKFGIKKSICIVESGDESLSSTHNKELKSLNFNYLPIKHKSREFSIGGSSNTWGGLTSHFHKFEFEERNFLNLNRWPIDYSTLLQWYHYVSKNYEFINTTEIDLDHLTLFNDFNLKPFFAFDNAVNYKKFLRDDVDLIYNAHAISIESIKNRINNVKISNIYTKTVSQIKANIFIFALGGLETIKLLLNSIDAKLLARKHKNDLIGKYFMEHPKFQHGTVKLKKNVDISPFVGFMENNLKKYYGVSLPISYQKEYNLLNCYVRFTPVLPWSNDKVVYLAIKFIKRSKIFYKLFLSLVNAKIHLLHHGETEEDESSLVFKKHSLIQSIINISLYLFYRISGIIPNNYEYIVINYIEMEPSIENNVYLSHEIDKLGQKKISVNYKISETVNKSIKHLHSMIDKYLQDNLFGDIESNLDLIKNPIYLDASHHMGGTIMGLSVDDSVVDKNLKYHTLDNLYIIGSSVMPTSGSHNPTFTVSALACMTADHIHKTHLHS
jgi:hypothetical protein